MEISTDTLVCPACNSTTLLRHTVQGADERVIRMKCARCDEVFRVCDPVVRSPLMPDGEAA